MAVNQKAQVIPGIPLAALDAITDPNVRQVLQSLIDGWHVRNGSSGSGDNRFITAAEAGLTKGNSAIGGYGNNASNPGNTTTTPANISRMILDLQAQVIESPLFKVLGERVDLIDKPGGIFTRLEDIEIVAENEATERRSADTAESNARTALGVRVGAAEAVITTETTARTNADNAIVTSVKTQFAGVNNNLALVQDSVTTVSNNVASQAQQISQVQASIGDNVTAIEQVAQASIDADGQINSRYAVKIDNYGYVSGYGLMSSANHAAPFSEFIVRADRFAIGSPSGPGIPPTVPFIVNTVASTARPVGVYMDNVFATAIYVGGGLSGARMEMRNNVIKVFDSAGRLRVKIGDLDA